MKNICFLHNVFNIDIDNELLRNFEVVQINCLIKKDENLQDGSKSLGFINDNIEKVYYIENRYNENNEQNYDNLKKYNVLIDNLVIKDKHLSLLLSHLAHKYIFLEKEGSLCLSQVIKNDDLYEVNEYTKNHFIKSLVCEQIDGVKVWPGGEMRQLIPAFKEYKKLAVKIQRFNFYGIKFSSKHWYIISPITKKDASHIKKNGISYDTFVTEIVQREDFIKLIEYTFEHNKSNLDGIAKLSKDEIKNEYLKLIKEYYDLEVMK